MKEGGMVNNSKKMFLRFSRFTSRISFIIAKKQVIIEETASIDFSKNRVKKLNETNGHLRLSTAGNCRLHLNESTGKRKRYLWIC